MDLNQLEALRLLRTQLSAFRPNGTALHFEA